MNVKEFKEDGSLTMLVWILISVFACAILGGLVSSAKVILTETDKAGSTATYKTCRVFDSAGAAAYEEQHQPSDRDTVPDFCLEYGTATQSTGDRAKSQMKLGVIYGGSLGFLPGMIIGDSKHRKQVASRS